VCHALRLFGLLRIGEYCCTSAGRSRLLVRHVIRSVEGVQLTVPWSKSDLSPACVRFSSRPDLLCPLAAARHYLSFFRHARDAGQPFFVTTADSGSALSDQAYREWLKRRAAAIGLDSRNISGHSLRRGGTTALFLAGVPETVIALHGRWRSTCYRRYFASTTPQWLATTTLLAHTRGLFTPLLPLSSSSSSSSSS
jgi:hypothetical protein